MIFRRRAVQRLAPPRKPPRPPRDLLKLAQRALEEDQAKDDRTTQALFPHRLPSKALIVAEAPARVAGLAYVASIGRSFGVRTHPYVREGALVAPGDPVMTVSGDLRRILAAERTMLNGLMHLSGVATATAHAARAALAGRGGPAIFATRKTLPGLRAVEKWAVELGGGEPHRMDLASGLLVKNNHLTAVSIEEAVDRLRRRWGSRWPIEIEVRSAEEAIRAGRAGANAILIDNQSPGDAAGIVRALERAGLRDRVWVELSGGITEENVGRYRSIGADAVSLGSLTHSAPSVPFHLTVLRTRRPLGRPA